MANFNEIKTRIALRTGDYAYWTTGAGKDIPLIKGEVCVCYVAAADNQAQTAPTILFKVCHEAGKKFGDLDWTSALAADVYGWAKQNKNDFVNTFLGLTMDDGKTTMQDKLNGVFATDAELASAVSGLQGELATALASYYTKTEIDGMFETLRGEISDLDVGAIEGRVNDLETATGVTIPGLINNVDAKFADYTKTADLDAKVDELGYAKVSELPTKVSELENDSAYLVAADIASKADSEQVAKDIAAAVAPLATTEALNALAGTHATDKQALEGAIAGVKATADAAATKEYTDAELAKKVDKTSYEADKATFAIAETVNAALAEKADKATTYTKEEADAAFATPAEVIGEVNKALAEVSNADSITNITTLVEYVNENASDLTALITEVYGSAEITGDSRIDTAIADSATAKSDAATAKSDAATAKSDAATALSTANEAKTAATTAQNSASASAAAAEASASAAAASASAASGSASAAAGSADTANTKAYEATEARDVAVGAEQGAVAAQEAAEAAKAAAEDAKLNAQENASAAGSASGMASEHATNADNAKKAAEAAQAKAEAAQAAAEASNTSATAIANAAKAEAEAATAASNAATQAVAGLHAVATSGSIYDLNEASKTDDGVTYLILNCNW